MTSHATWVDLKGKDVVPETVDHVIVPVRSSSSFAPWGNSFLFDQETDGVHLQNQKNLFQRENATLEEKSQIIKRMKLESIKKIIDTFQMSSCLIFCRTNLDCDHLEQYFINLSIGGGGSGGGGGGGRGGGKHSGKRESGKEHVYSCVVVAGKRQQRERRENLDAFRDGDGTLKFL